MPNNNLELRQNPKLKTIKVHLLYAILYKYKSGTITELESFHTLILPKHEHIHGLTFVH